ncbi:MAG: zinc ribbon domain-containing protein [Chloroflexota bacterium]
MDIGSVLLILALFILVALYISRPIFEGHAVQVGADEHELSMLLAERDRVINALNELEFDNDLGKVPEGDYPDRRKALMQYGANILQQLDENFPETESGINLDADELPSKSLKKLTHQDDDLESMIAARRRSRAEKTGGFCPQCGHAVQQSDRFCPKCGSDLT